MKISNYILNLIKTIGRSNNSDFPSKVFLDSLVSTNFSYTLSQPIENNNNYIYSPTLLFAWNYLKKNFNATLISNNNLVNYLDKSELYKNSLQKNEYDNSVELIKNKIIIESRFKKSLQFNHRFKKNNAPLNFNGLGFVESFGCNGCKTKVRKQIEIIHFKSQEEFALRLKMKDGINEMLLYKPSQKMDTLMKIYKQLKNEMDKKTNELTSWIYKFSDRDIFEVPIIEFHIENNIKELIGIEFSTKNFPIEIEKSIQTIALMLNEKGAKIQSEAKINVAIKSVPKRFIFDKPFLIAIKKIEFENPYLLLWIENTELMKKKTLSTSNEIF